MRHSLFANEDGNGFRVLLEQASHEIHRGAYDIGLQYLNKALTVRDHSNNTQHFFESFLTPVFKTCRLFIKFKV